ncbi:CaiF/GrlA family transcriptional regulator [Salmonella enterica]|nr:CaiF/GrlA family transcriptional regulator [Salmonella enterica]EEB5698893.1 CaiF/GrlA family transcriptional regulator [Salmonella enterica]EGX5147669.1 hypothetical protein [Salmonella enterica]EHQ9354999.1 CaiF/GrlA family transcriptional regulator [Salmonella enterica]EHR1670992.1 CaiF/GrlA family transcriptional regulator [Salmonella enterica]
MIRGGDFRECDGWLCPITIQHIGTRVLYQAVAYWAQLQGRGVTVKEVSEAFGIPHRRASDVLHYIVHEASSFIEASVSQSRVGGNGRQQKVVRVWRVFPQRFPQTEKMAKKISGLSKPAHRRVRPARDASEIQHLRTWFLTRRRGETLPYALISGSSEENTAPALKEPDCG